MEINKKILLPLLIFICLILIFAYFIEYQLGHKPCNLCLYQRIPYFLSILLIAKILTTERYQKITLLLLSLIFIISSVLAFYHFGIEQSFFSETSICENKNLTENISKEQLIKELKKNIISCKDVSFKVFGFSLASINTIFSMILSVIFMRLFFNYGKN
jgi:disulfide bond formation protein DsbB